MGEKGRVMGKHRQLVEEKTKVIHLNRILEGFKCHAKDFEHHLIGNSEPLKVFKRETMISK